MIQDIPDPDWMLDTRLAPAFEAMLDHGLVFDASGARLRSVPFTPGRVKAALYGSNEPQGLSSINGLAGALTARRRR